MTAARSLTLAAGLLLAMPIAVGHAAEWQTPSGDMRMKTVSEAENPFVLTLGGVTIECSVADWPISQPVGKLGCSDGSTHTIELLDKQTVKVDGVVLSGGAE
ncbi:MAG: hypothetical protein LCH99_24235 [Proteobacteria bacterium]|nr:hypothetical protein [Pseudomonadota bacterium]